MLSTPGLHQLSVYMSWVDVGGAFGTDLLQDKPPTSLQLLWVSVHFPKSRSRSGSM